MENKLLVGRKARVDLRMHGKGNRLQITKGDKEDKYSIAQPLWFRDESSIGYVLTDDKGVMHE